MTHPFSRRAVTVRPLAIFAVAFLAACSSGTEPAGPPTVLRIAGQDQQGQINAQLATPLSVKVTDAGSQPLAGVTVTWTVEAGGGSVSPTSSQTSAAGVATTVWTLGPGTGEHRVRATASGVAVTFTATATSTGDCTDPVALGPGGVCLASPSQLASLQIAGGAGGEFVIITHYDGSLTRAPINVTANGTGVMAVTGPPTPNLIPSMTGGFGASGVLLPDHAFERQLRTRERALLRPLVSGGGGGARLNISGGASRNVVPAPPRYAIGDQLILNTNSESACAVVPDFMKAATVRAESQNAIIVEDNENPPGFTQADYNQILDNFENVVRPSNTNAFGTHTDVDKNNKILIFYTIEVNRLTDPGSGSFVGGFFFSRDLFPSAEPEEVNGRQLGACTGSNYAEMFYMLAPDPEGCFSSNGQCPGPTSNRRDVGFVKSTTAGTIAHEYQHLINASRRLRITPGATLWEAVWLDEGLAHIAEELAYYRATGSSPRTNLGYSAVTSSETTLNHLNAYQTANLARYSAYLKAVSAQSPYGESNPAEDGHDLETRGAIWAFLRWAADHRGTAGDGDTWQRLVRDATATGMNNLMTVFGQNIGARFREWAGATYMDDAPGMPTGDDAFLHPSWNFRSVLPALSSNAQAFPLQVRSIVGEQSFTLVDGGAAYLRFAIPSGTTATVNVTSNGGQLPTGTSAWVVRTK